MCSNTNDLNTANCIIIVGFDGLGLGVVMYYHSLMCLLAKIQYCLLYFGTYEATYYSVYSYAY